MTVKEIAVNQWFKRVRDGRIFVRLAGEEAVVDDANCVPVKPLQPTLRLQGFYMPAEEPVEAYKYNFLRVA